MTLREDLESKVETYERLKAYYQSLLDTTPAEALDIELVGDISQSLREMTSRTTHRLTTVKPDPENLWRKR